MSNQKKFDESFDDAMPVYQADDDSFFFTKKILGELGLWITQEGKQLSDLSFLDMGTGSGYIAFELIKYGARNITAVDINSKAIEEMSSLVELEELPVRVMQSDLFSKFSQEKFDCILFNTPYLPNDEEEYLDPSLHGGPKGYEVALRFLEQAKNHLTKNGRVYLLTSSLAQPEEFEKKAKKLGWSLSLIAIHSLFFEQLLCYECQLETEQKNEKELAIDVFFLDESELRLRNINFESIKKKIPSSYSFEGVLALGKRGIVSLVKKTSNGEFFVAKTQHDATTALQPIVLEAQQLKLVNELGIGPRLEFFNEDVVIMQYVQGDAIGDWLQKTTTVDAIIAVTQDVLTQCVLLDEAGINKFEMTNPYKHVIIGGVDNLTCTMIDFERAKKTIRPKNVSQFKEFVKNRILPRLKELGSDLEMDYFIEN